MSSVCVLVVKGHMCTVQPGVSEGAGARFISGAAPSGQLTQSCSKYLCSSVRGSSVRTQVHSTSIFLSAAL